MKRVCAALLAVAMTAPSIGLAAQAKPNFTGKWTLVGTPEGGYAPFTSNLGGAFEANQNEKTLTLIRGNDPTEFRTVYTLDGTDTRNARPGSVIEFVSRTRWDGTRLIITDTFPFAGPAGYQPVTLTQTWSLDAAGHLVVESTNNFPADFPGRPKTTPRATYRK